MIRSSNTSSDRDLLIASGETLTLSFQLICYGLRYISTNAIFGPSFIALVVGSGTMTVLSALSRDDLLDQGREYWRVTLEQL